MGCTALMWKAAAHQVSPQHGDVVTLASPSLEPQPSPSHCQQVCSGYLHLAPVMWVTWSSRARGRELCGLLTPT